jgi:hypothetical protein
MRAVRLGAIIGGLVFALVLGSPAPSVAKNRMVVFPAEPEQLPAVRYASLGSDRCLSELSARKIPHWRGPKTSSIETPVMLSGPIAGVRFEFAYPLAPEAKKNLLDCRLLLALDDMAKVASERGFTTIRYNSMYRGRRARVPGQRHAAGVAIDVIELVKKDGTVFNVLKDFSSNGIGSRTCGDGAAKAATGKASELRDLVCALDRARIFNLVLTPHYDRRHKNHLHLEVRSKIRWFLTQ